MVRAIVLLCFFSGIVSVFADEPVTQDVGSLVEAFRAQTSSWEKGDVLIRVEKFHDSTGGNGEGDYRETLGYYRFRFDHLNQNYWYYGASESRSGDGSLNPVRKEQLHVDRSAFAIIKGSARIRSFPNRSVRAEFKDFQEWADQYNFRKVGLRNIGFTPFGESRISQGNNSATAMASGYVETTVHQLADGNSKAFFKFPVQRAYQRDIVAETVWVWDSDLLSPIEAALYENGVMEGRRYRVKTWEEKIQWKSKNDVLLPIRIFFDFPYSIRRGDELVTLSDTRLTQFHWISINEDIPAEDFAISLDDFAAIESQIDPEKVGANFQ